MEMMMTLDFDGVDDDLRGLGLIIVAYPLDPEPKRKNLAVGQEAEWIGGEI